MGFLFFKNLNEEVKQVIVVRQDLKMGKGKLASQVAHASLCAFLESQKYKKKLVNLWLNRGMKKVVLKVSSRDELYALYKKSISKDLPCCLIRDAGRTQINAGEETALGIGPYYEKDIDEITQHLKLL